MKFKPRVRTRRVILHDSHTDPSVERVIDVLRWQGMKMGLLDIGYHWAVERDGTQIPLRDEATIGTHTPGHNLDSIGVVLIGGRAKHVHEDGDGGGFVYHPDRHFPEDQMVGLYDLLLGIKRRYAGIAVFGHSEVQRYRDRSLPDCPCLDMQDLRADLLTYAATGVA